MTATDSADLPAHSRYFRPAVSIDGRRLGLSWEDADYDILAHMEGAVLIPCSDLSVAWLARLPEELRARFPSSIPSTAALDTLLDKRNFAELCKRLDVPHPRYCLVASEDDLSRAPLEELSDWFFKPSDSQRFMARYGRKGLRFTGRVEAESLFRKFSGDAVSVLLQEYVPGGADQHYFIDGFRDRDGIVRARLARRRLRIYPRDFGNSSYCHQVPVKDVEPAWRSLQLILEHLHYRGIFSAEFKFDAHRNEYRILEVNTRVWLYVEFAAHCDIDVCFLSYLDALEQDVPDLADNRPGAGCVDLYNDFRSIAESPSEHRPSLFQLLRQWFGARKLLFCWDDPKPALVWLYRRMMSRLRRSGGAIEPEHN